VFVILATSGQIKLQTWVEAVVSPAEEAGPAEIKLNKQSTRATVEKILIFDWPRDFGQFLLVRKKISQRRISEKFEHLKRS
jgi:hypothetical protein